ncbi:hypothetical protein Desor_0546 [Desulfosporosinus orientis DSM 765]|uniref:Uncharacterized protein n=1 Tax=Desulfosporosinus orientis (strain ATCC 19365 / DSM 765 / NCIMB 8382 / VKM B-1628 / Singapore I) TaxID=768706 RepID=G7WCC5_DESOD|nr:hypothetical protein [Desulfosporosinus orientis]AET66247.1 hypothetical protein Desor_0546 [Desulfosporosinus orientis DSM 765]
MTAVLIVVVLGLVSLALIGYPIWRGYGDERGQGEWPSLDITGEKDAIMATLSEIEFDYHMKKLSEEDYRTLKNKYAKIALAILDT